VSVPYYTRLERGDMHGVSQSVLEALARALELDDAERAHLFDLARAAQPTVAQPRRRQADQRVRPEVQWTLDAISGAAAFVGNERLDILAANQLGRALFSKLYAAPARPVNNARFCVSARSLQRVRRCQRTPPWSFDLRCVFRRSKPVCRVSARVVVASFGRCRPSTTLR
jgi:hypothetical protein